MRYQAVRKMLKQVANEAGIKKRIYPHLFRHSRATHLTNKLTEAQMCGYFGWVQGSDMPSTYVHLSGRDVANAILEIHGMKEREKEDEELKVRKCPRCGQKNPPEAKRCNQCGLIWDVKKGMEKVKQEKRFVKEYFAPEKIEKLVRKEIRKVLKNKESLKN